MLLVNWPQHEIYTLAPFKWPKSSTLFIAPKRVTINEQHNMDEDQSQKLSRKATESPMMVVGLAGLLVVCGIGAYKFRNRGTMPVPQFLMQLRVAAQGTVVAALCGGAVYSMLSGGADSKKKNKNKWKMYNTTSTNII